MITVCSFIIYFIHCRCLISLLELSDYINNPDLHVVYCGFEYGIRCNSSTCIITCFFTIDISELICVCLFENIYNGNNLVDSRLTGI